MAKTTLRQRVDLPQIRRWKESLPPIFDNPLGRSHKKVQMTTLKMIHKRTRQVDGDKNNALNECI
jgi:hypothetical protein